LNRYAYPSTNGTSCTCHDSNGGTCLALCSSKFENYNLQTKNGNATTVICPDGTYALGCGNYPIKTTVETVPTVLVINDNTCFCYNYNGVTCFAICGN